MPESAPVGAMQNTRLSTTRTQRTGACDKSTSERRRERARVGNKGFELVRWKLGDVELDKPTAIACTSL